MASIIQTVQNSSVAVMQTVQNSSAAVVQTVQNFFAPKIQPTAWRVIKGQGVVAGNPIDTTYVNHHHQQHGVMESVMNFFKPKVQPTTWIVNPMGGVRVGQPLKAASSINTTHPSTLDSVTAFFIPKTQPTNWNVDSTTGHVYPGHDLKNASSSIHHPTTMDTVKAFFTPKIQPTKWIVHKGRGVQAAPAPIQKPIFETIQETSRPVFNSIKSMFTSRIEPTTWRKTHDGRIIAMGDKSNWSSHYSNYQPQFTSNGIAPINNNLSKKSNQTFLQSHPMTERERNAALHYKSNTQMAKEALTSAAITTKQAVHDVMASQPVQKAMIAVNNAGIQAKQAVNTAGIQAKQAVNTAGIQAKHAVNNAGIQAKQAFNETFSNNPQHIQGSMPIEQTHQIRTTPIESTMTQPSFGNQGIQQPQQNIHKSMPMETFKPQQQQITPVMENNNQTSNAEKNVYVSIAQPNLMLTIATGPAQNTNNMMM